MSDFKVASDKLDRKHTDELHREAMGAGGMRPNDMTVLRQRTERKDLNEKHMAAHARLKVWQKAAMEAAIKKTGGAL